MNRKMSRSDGPGGRFYEVDGRRLPSVTHILSCLSKPALIAWAANEERSSCVKAATELYERVASGPRLHRLVFEESLNQAIGTERAHRRKMAAAASIGTEAHSLIERRLRKLLGQEVAPEERVSDAAAYAVIAWEVWAREHQLKPIAVERPVYSLVYGYAGTVDLIAEVDGVLSILDWKTGKAIYSEAHLQTAAYAAACDEMGLGPIKQSIIVRLPKTAADPGFEVVLVDPEEPNFATFVVAITVWRWWHEAEAKNRAAYKAKKAKDGDAE